MANEGVDPTVVRRPADATNGQRALLQGLIDDTEARAESLRCVQIPHHVGMAAAARSLATDLPRVLAAQIQGELSSGDLSRTWESTLKRLSKTETGRPTPEAELAAVAALLLELVQRVAKHLAAQSEQWARDAYRLEGHADALDEQRGRLQRAQERLGQAPPDGDGRIDSEPGEG